MRHQDQKRILALLVVLVIILLTLTLGYYLLEPSKGVSSTFVSKPQVTAYTIEYQTQTSSTSPNGITVDSSGDVWFALWNDSSIAELFPTNGTIHEYHVPGLRNGSMTTWGMSVDNSLGLVWFTELSSNSIWSFNMKDDVFIRHKLTTPNAFPFGLTIDEYHNVWFAELFGNKIGEIFQNGSMVELSVPAGSSEPSGITTDSTGRVWFTLPGINSIGSYFEGKFTIENLTGLVTTPVGIAIDSYGNIWLTQHGPSFISEFNPDTHYFKTISTSNNSLIESLPYFCWIDQYGNVWFNEHQGNAIGEFLPANNTLVEYFIPTAIKAAGNISYMLTSALSPGGVPWYTELLAGKVGTVNTSKPLDVGLQLPNDTSSESLPNGSSVDFGLSITSNSSLVNLRGYVGNFTGNFSFIFTPPNGFGDFNSTLCIRNDGSEPGVYFLTLTARTNTLAVSRIIEVKVP